MQNSKDATGESKGRGMLFLLTRTYCNQVTADTVDAVNIKTCVLANEHKVDPQGQVRVQRTIWSEETVIGQAAREAIRSACRNGQEGRH